jgi:hypothetical protein
MSWSRASLGCPFAPVITTEKKSRGCLGGCGRLDGIRADARYLVALEKESEGG